MIFKFSYSYIITFFRFKKKIFDMYTLPYLFIYLFIWGISLVVESGSYSLVAMRWLLIVLLLLLHSTGSVHTGCSRGSTGAH